MTVRAKMNSNDGNKRTRDIIAIICCIGLLALICGSVVVAIVTKNPIALSASGGPLVMIMRIIMKYYFKV